MKIGYLGPSGTFSEQAARMLQRNYIECGQPESSIELIPLISIEEVFAFLIAGKVEEGVVPVENSVEGIVNSTLDTLFAEEDIFIKRRYSIPVINNIMVNKKCLEEGSLKIERIYSHPQPLGQCRRFLRENYPDAQLLPVSSTSEAARMIAENYEPNTAAIANSYAAQIYDLAIINSGIQEKDNSTKFAVITKEDTSEPTLGKRMSMAFSTDRNEPGSLMKVLEIFAMWDINLTSIYSRPMKDKLGEYIFAVDLDPCDRPDDFKDALKMVRRKTTFFKPLGTYFEEIL